MPNILLLLLVFFLSTLLLVEVRFSDELLLAAELASDDVRAREVLKSAVPMISSSLTSDPGEVVVYESSSISVNLEIIFA